MIRPLLSNIKTVLAASRRGLAVEKSLNRVTLLGRAGSDAQLKGTDEHPVVTFSLATNSNQKAEWHRISVFKPGLRSVAEKYVKSGTRMLIEGKISYGHIIDKNGASSPITSIIADELVFLTKDQSPPSESHSDY